MLDLKQSCAVSIVRSVPLTILDGSTFCVCDERGDIDAPTAGLFAEDTRFLSRCVLTVNGERPLFLSTVQGEPFNATFFVRNPIAGGLGRDEMTIARARNVSDGMEDSMVVRSHAARPLAFSLEVELATDFADIFAVKQYDFSLGDPLHARPLPPPADSELTGDDGLVFASSDGYPGRTQIFFSSQPVEVENGRAHFAVELEPRQEWALRMYVLPEPDGDSVSRRSAERQLAQARAHAADASAAWRLSVPKLETTWSDLAGTYRRSLSDLASLRLGEQDGTGGLIAAGTPWFMTVFGRDALITALQTMLLGPDLARVTLHTLADLQATEDDPSIDAEPGKIIHEMRRGRAARVWVPRYYGTVDATPLYLILLSELWRWTNDGRSITELRGPAMRALEWIDRYGDHDGDGFVEYERRASIGPLNQCWKDSDEAIAFADGTRATGAIAAAEVQGYVYDAKLRCAELAREVWRDRGLAERLTREAGELKERFNDAFWCDRGAGKIYALALDGDKRPVDSLCSNIGHLLWSGIVAEDRAAAVVDLLMAEELWSGWGVRTMATGDGSYNPLTYHNGTVWPHDNSLIALGLERYGYRSEALRIVRSLLAAAGSLGDQLPEVFGGFPRSEAPQPIAYPTATKPQAWAAGAPILLLQVLLGLEPDRSRETLRSAAGEIPAWAGSLRLGPVQVFGSSWSVRVEDGTVSVTPA
ncbi:MAG: amylo-alpha-1,6-glucosidase [Actinobacteria bacterium]|nr:MAG: amylo-alpha-1,6-glucosidase [Actinomycetota bacterium]